jgi:hypothetical protein
VNKLNNQKWTADKGCFSIWGLGEGLKTPHKKYQLVTKYYRVPRIWTESGVVGKIILEWILRK